MSERSGPRAAGILALVLIAIAATGCGAGGGNDHGSRHRDRGDGVSFVVPPGWHRVPLAGLPGAQVPIEVASFRPRGPVRAICDPRRITGRIPAGGALVQVLATPAAAVGHQQVLRNPPLRRPFRLGAPRGFECGESHRVFFRAAGRLYTLRVWTGVGGAGPAVRHGIESLMDSLRFGGQVERSSGPALSYGPYLGVRCPRPNRIGCDRVGIDLVLGRPARRVSATLAGRVLALRTPGLHTGVRGEDWVGTLDRAGLTRRGSPFFIGSARTVWVGDPPVHVPVLITATLGDGTRRALLLPRVTLSPGWG
ncbi:MAG: hypothetical protein QM729_03820 [Solirubrobacterales bacterium]